MNSCLLDVFQTSTDTVANSTLVYITKGVAQRPSWKTFNALIILFVRMYLH